MSSQETLRDLIDRFSPPPLLIALSLSLFLLHQLFTYYPGLIHDLSKSRGMGDKARVAPASKRLASRVSIEHNKNL